MQFIDGQVDNDYKKDYPYGSTILNRENPKSLSLCSEEAFLEAKRSAIENGLMGELFIHNYLELLAKTNKIKNFEWISKCNKYSPYDFSIINLDGNLNLIDSKATKRDFEQPIYISYRELEQMAFGNERYDIYRVYEMNSTTAKLRICKDLRIFAKKVLDVFEGLPTGVSVAASVMVSPSSLEFGPEIAILRN